RIVAGPSRLAKDAKGRLRCRQRAHQRGWHYTPQSGRSLRRCCRGGASVVPPPGAGLSSGPCRQRQLTPDAQGATMRYLITGGCGFIGSHLSEALVARGDTVTVLDDLSTGRIDNVSALDAHPKF